METIKNMELKDFKDTRKKEKKSPEQLKFDLDLKLKAQVNNKIGYKIKEKHKYRRFERI